MINNKQNIFPICSQYIENAIKSFEIDLEKISIRELNKLVDEVSKNNNVNFLRFEFGIPGLEPNKLAIKEEIRILKNKPHLIGTYPPFDGIPYLKKETASFVKNFLNINVSPQCCIPTVGAMHGGLICQSLAGRLRQSANTILFLDPGFPVNKLQTKFLGLNHDSIDLYDFRGQKLLDELERKLSNSLIGGVLWSSPNNPSWVCLKEEELEGIGKLLTKYDVIAIEDAAYLGMDFRIDYSVPSQPPYIPTIANYTKNYFIIISSSKIFSYAGQRIAVTIISPDLMEKRFPNLKDFYNTEKVGHAFVHGGIYPTTAGVSQTPQYALAALFEASNKGKFSFFEDVNIYALRANKLKKIFLKYGFHLVYAKDMDEPIGDGFYFTISHPKFDSKNLLFEMLRYGMAGIPLETTGSRKEGVRICVSLISNDDMDELEIRLELFKQNISQQTGSENISIKE